MYPTLASDGKVIKLYGVFQDITERKQQELALKESEARFRALSQTANDAIITANKFGNIVSWNNGAERIFGYNYYEIIEKPLSVIMPDKFIKSHNEGINRVSNNGEKHVVGSTVELEALHKNKTILPIELSLSEWEVSGEKYFTGIIRDISKRKQSEELILSKNKELENLNITKDKFFSIISHDLKGPFSVLLGISELIIDSANTFDKDKILYLSKGLNQSANNTFKLLENLLAWARLQRGAIVPQMKKNNVKEIVFTSIQILEEIARNKEICIEYNIENELFASCDENITSTIIRNLTSNAIKFTKNGGIIKIAAFEIDNKIQISISDNGVGMKNEKIQSIFELGKNKSTKGTQGEKGTGLGLIICKELIEKQDGKIWATSVEQEGTTFYFTLNCFTKT